MLLKRDPHQGTKVCVERQKFKPPSVEFPQGDCISENESLLKDVLPNSAFAMLKDSETGLHEKVELH
jgi:hypothetical protein